MSQNTFPLLPRLQQQLSELGEHLRLARLRRRLSAARVAERAGLGLSTVRAVEQGAATVGMGAYARVLLVLGLEKNLARLASEDALGRKLQDAELLVKKRAPRVKTAPPQ